jgi:hypothetical protein
MIRIGSAVALVVASAALAGASGALAVPGNDMFVSPVIMSGEVGHVEGTTYGATKDVGEPDHADEPGGASVWFSWTAPRSGRVIVDACGSAFDTVLAAYTGADVAALTEVAANDDACDERSVLAFDVVAGTAYRIAVDGVAGQMGDIFLAWAMEPAAGSSALPNDHIETATAIGGWFGTVDGTNLNATHQVDEPVHGEFTGSGSLWYRWTAPGTGWVEFETCATDFDTVVAAYRGAAIGALTRIGYGDSWCGHHAGGGLIFLVEAGASYAVAVDGFGPGHRGSFSLAWDLLVTPVAQVPPTVTGLVRGGQVLTGHLGEWNGQPPITFEFWWERCQPIGIDCFPILGSHGSRTVTIGFSESLRFAVKATNRVGSTTAYSSRAASPPGPPVNTSLPVIAGTPRVRQVIRVVTYGQWQSEYPLEYEEVWQRCQPGTMSCTRVFPPHEEGWEGGAYRVEAGDLGSMIRLTVIASHIAASASAVSAPTGVVTGGSPTACVVPRLVGKRLRAARAALTRSRCRLGSVRRVRSARKRGLIVRQSPAPGKRLRLGARVNVVLSLGRRR